MLTFLIGYMASGKTTIGRKIAKQLQMQFCDLDYYIEKNVNQSIAGIFELKGEEEFRKIEHQALEQIINSGFNGVVACGGGTPCHFNNIELMNRNGITVYLKESINTIHSRLIKNKSKRPLLKDLNEHELLQKIETQLKSREPFYLRAQITYNIETMGFDDLISMLISHHTQPE